MDPMTPIEFLTKMDILNREHWRLRNEGEFEEAAKVEAECEALIAKFQQNPPSDFTQVRYVVRPMEATR